MRSHSLLALALGLAMASTIPATPSELTSSGVPKHGKIPKTGNARIKRQAKAERKRKSRGKK